MSYHGNYTVQMDCDYGGAGGVCMRQQQYHGDSRSECVGKALSEGWIIESKEKHCLCSSCVEGGYRFDEDGSVFKGPDAELIAEGLKVKKRS